MRESVEFGDGFYPEESDQKSTWRWARSKALIRFPKASRARFIRVRVASMFQDLSQSLKLSSGGNARCFSLLPDRSDLSSPIPPGAGSAELTANKNFPRAYYPSDSRDLAYRVEDAFLHTDPELHAHLGRQYRNAVLNRREMLAGRTVLKSTAPVLGVDLTGACNMKPPCVFCEWDFAKRLEGSRVSAPFNAGTIRGYGPVFENARTVISCGIGEPFAKKDLDEVLAIFSRQGKSVEIATNGQLLSDRNIERMLGLDLRLYVSVDAATSRTYARLRNGRFERVLDNMRRLIRAKGGPKKLPLVHLVFMPMRANMREVERFAELCAELQADSMILRHLNLGPALVWERKGYRFDYRKELLSFKELVRVSRAAGRACGRLGVILENQLDFGAAPGESAHDPAKADPPQQGHVERMPSLGWERLPLCQEPWRNAYILRRGVTPCCFGGIIAPMDRYRQAWNSALLREMRAKLAEGKAHAFCLDTPSCPILRRHLKR